MNGLRTRARVCACSCVFVCDCWCACAVARRQGCFAAGILATIGKQRPKPQWPLNMECTRLWPAPHAVCSNTRGSLRTNRQIGFNSDNKNSNHENRIEMGTQRRRDRERENEQFASIYICSHIPYIYIIFPYSDSDFLLVSLEFEWANEKESDCGAHTHFYFLKISTVL